MAGKKKAFIILLYLQTFVFITNAARLEHEDEEFEGLFDNGEADQSLLQEESKEKENRDHLGSVAKAFQAKSHMLDGVMFGHKKKKRHAYYARPRQERGFAGGEEAKLDSTMKGRKMKKRPIYSPPAMAYSWNEENAPRYNSEDRRGRVEYASNDAVHDAVELKGLNLAERKTNPYFKAIDALDEDNQVSFIETHGEAKKKHMNQMHEARSLDKAMSGKKKKKHRPYYPEYGEYYGGEEYAMDGTMRGKGKKKKRPYSYVSEEELFNPNVEAVAELKGIGSEGSEVGGLEGDKTVADRTIGDGKGIGREEDFARGNFSNIGDSPFMDVLNNNFNGSKRDVHF